MENRRVPELRFAGFVDNWKEHKVGEFLTESRIPGKNGLEAKKLTVKLWRKGVVPKDEAYQGSEATKYYIRKAGQFIYGKLDFLHQAFGIIPDKLDGYESTLDSPAFDIADKVNSFFFLEYVSRKQFYLYQGTIASGSRKAKRIHSETFFEMPLRVPVVEEQNNIGDFFLKIDDVIALYQQELTILKRAKQGFLQKMFPKEGESVPEIRFPGFTGEWEQRRLGNHAQILTGGTPTTQMKEYWEPKEVPWMSSGEVHKKRLSSTDNMISRLGLERSSARWVKKNSVLIALAGQGKTRGTVAINEISLTTNQSIAAIVPNGELHYEFIFQNLEQRYEELRLISSGDGSRGGLNKQLVSDVEIISPSVEEQIKIGDFFKQLDNLTSLMQLEFDTLKETKKAFLQKMFV